MTTEDMIRALGNVIEEYKNKPVFTGQTDIPMMCMDVIGKLKELSNPWHTGTPTEEGFWLVKYKCVVDGKYNGRLTYRAVKIEKDKIDGFAYESGGIGAEEYWKPIEYQKIDDLWRREE